MGVLSRQVYLLQTFEKKICELHNISRYYFFFMHICHMFIKRISGIINIDVKIYDVVYEHIYGLKFS